METEINITMRESTSVYNPHYVIEKDGHTIINIYTDAFNSEAQAQMVAQTILLKLQNIFNK